MAAPNSKYYLDREAKMETEKSYWKNQWQLTCEYVFQRRADFTASKSPGAFISSQLWTDEPTHMAETSASALLGYLWAAAEKSFKLRGNTKIFKKDRAIMEWWAETTEALQEEMADPEAGLATALDEGMLELIVLGTEAILGEERNQDKPDLGCLAYEPWSLLEYSLDENAAGKAVEFYRRKEFTAPQMVEKYGLNKVSRNVREAFERGRDTKFTVLQVICPRKDKDRKPGSKAAKDMPIASIHIETESKHICRNSGYPELPVHCARLAKRLKEKYGRGKGMSALPSIMMLNQVLEDAMLAMEKKLDPPMYVLNGSVAGGGVVETSAGAMTVLRLDKNAPNVPPVGKLFDVQDTRDVKEVVELLTETISNHFMIDRLINMNNDREMTAREALLRNAIRQSTLRSVVSRILMELFEPLINQAFMICLRRGKFGYMPNDPRARALERSGQEVKYIPQPIIDAITSGKDLYSIEYMTPAARDQMAEEGQGMIEVVEMAGQLAQFDESIPDRVDAQWTMTRFAEVRGASAKMFRKESDANKRFEARQEQRAKAQEAELAVAAGKVAKDTATAQNVATRR